MDLTKVIFEKQGPIAIITLNRPESLNALDEQLHAELGWCWEEVKHDEEIQVAIVTGRGRAFCAGTDLKERAEYAARGEQPPRTSRRDNRTFGLPGVHEVDKVIIAAVNGICVGGGQGIALDCDIRIASTDASFGDVEIKAGMVGRIDKVVRAYPPAVAMYLGLTGDLISAAQAYQWGFVSHLVEPSELMPTAMSIAQRIVANPPLAVKAYRDIARRAPGMTPADAQAYLHAMHARVLASRDYVEAVSSFAERRAGKFEGR